MRMLSALVLLCTFLAFLLVLDPIRVASAHHSPAATPRATVRVTPTVRSAATATPTEVDKSRPGSTDGLVLMSIVIALIIIVPILLQRGLWAK